MYEYVISKDLDNKLAKIAKKNRPQLEQIDNKIQKIIHNPTRFKKLKGDLSGASRVHINTHFVLIFEYNEQKNIV